MKQVTVSVPAAYPVFIGEGLLADAGGRIASVCGGGTAMLVTDDTVNLLYADTLERSLREVGYRTARFIFPHGEKSKTMESYAALLGALVKAGLSRTDVIVALGGGVAGDLAGFAAATYLRGVSFVQMPTTLLSMVDSSIGGKTAINLAAGKNLVGAFWPPKLVLCDVSTLRTLPEAAFRDGIAEMIKHGVVTSAGLFAILREKVDIDSPLEDLIELNVTIKRDIVARDERDTGRRQILNFGHTVGHAIEALSEYRVSHGSAVAVGMALMSRGAYQIGVSDEKCPLEIEAMLALYGFPSRTLFTPEQLAEAALRDKKRNGQQITLALPVKIGKCVRNTFRADELAGFLRLALRE